MTQFITLPDGDYIAAVFVLHPCVMCKAGQVHPVMNASERAHVADRCSMCRDTIWHDWPFEPYPTMIRSMANADPKQMVVGRIGGNGAEIHQSDLEHVALLSFANEIVRRAALAKAAGGDSGNTRAAALMSAANSLRYVLNMPAEVLP